MPRLVLIETCFFFDSLLYVSTILTWTLDIMRINKKFSRYFQINLDISWKHFLFTFFICVLVCLYLLIVPISWSGAPRVPRLYLLIFSVSWSGAPRVPRLMMNQHNILPQTSEYNVTWTTDSFAPVTNYLLYYRKNKVKLRSKRVKQYIVLTIKLGKFS